MNTNTENKYLNQYPRVLIISPTIIDDITATGSLVKKLFIGWPKHRLAQVYCTAPKTLDYTVCDRYYKLSSSGKNNKLLAAICDYDPHVIYYRPHDKPLALHIFIQKLIAVSSAALVTHMMDDWPEKVRIHDADNYALVDDSLRKVFSKSTYNFAISKGMAAAYRDLYKTRFYVQNNFIQVEDWLNLDRKKFNDGYIVRYCGSLAEDMQLNSIYDIAHAISELHETMDIHFEVYVNNAFLRNARKLQEIPGCSVHKQVSRSDYAQLLSDADLLVIAANYDPDSIAYTRYSLASKLPEYMASGTPVLAYGPLEVETIAYCQRTTMINMVTEHDLSKLKKMILKIHEHADEANRMAVAAKTYALENCNANAQRNKFQSMIKNARGDHFKSCGDNIIVGPYKRGSRIDYQEYRLIEKLAGNSRKVMINVGAHYGGALYEFIIKGWHVFAFEPDKKNRSILSKRYRGKGNLEIIADAVSDDAREKSPFYTSDQSSGISTLEPFHESHMQTDYVNITTLEIFCEERNINSVNFLMVDAEGYDLQVLRGFPWSKISPEFVICEFEDRKTKKLGYSFRDLADYLVEKGYDVLLSEWYPVKEYGRRHDWRCLKHYPCELAEKGAWGNLVAFRDMQDWSRVYALAGAEAVPAQATTYKNILKKIYKALRNSSDS